jgi:uncharacterized glyoxalase superfamily protein PhnB
MTEKGKKTSSPTDIYFCNLYLDYTKWYIGQPQKEYLLITALAAATSLQEPANQFYGDRTAGVKDSFGNQWWFATHV